MKVTRNSTLTNGTGTFSATLKTAGNQTIFNYSASGWLQTVQRKNGDANAQTLEQLTYTESTTLHGYLDTALMERFEASVA